MSQQYHALTLGTAMHGQKLTEMLTLQQRLVQRGLKFDGLRIFLHELYLWLIGY